MLSKTYKTILLILSYLCQATEKTGTLLNLIETRYKSIGCEYSRYVSLILVSYMLLLNNIFILLFYVIDYYSIYC